VCCLCGAGARAGKGGTCCLLECSCHHSCILSCWQSTQFCSLLLSACLCGPMYTPALTVILRYGAGLQASWSDIQYLLRQGCVHRCSWLCHRWCHLQPLWHIHSPAPYLCSDRDHRLHAAGLCAANCTSLLVYGMCGGHQAHDQAHDGVFKCKVQDWCSPAWQCWCASALGSPHVVMGSHRWFMSTTV
jgi:hypothetical protein